MTRLYGRDWTRSELLRHVGRLDQVAGVRLVTLEDGPRVASVSSSSAPVAG